VRQKEAAYARVRLNAWLGFGVLDDKVSIPVVEYCAVQASRVHALVKDKLNTTDFNNVVCIQCCAIEETDIPARSVASNSHPIELIRGKGGSGDGSRDRCNRNKMGVSSDQYAKRNKRTIRQGQLGRHGRSRLSDSAGFDAQRETENPKSWKLSASTSPSLASRTPESLADHRVGGF
jgi:hypothetical protein